MYQYLYLTLLIQSWHVVTYNCVWGKRIMFTFRTYLCGVFTSMKGTRPLTLLVVAI